MRDQELAADVDDAIEVTRNLFVRGVLKSLACELEAVEALARKLRRRVGFQKQLLSGAVCQCIYCGQGIDREDVNHWAVCPRHPATAEVIRLQAIVESQHDAIVQLSSAVEERDARIRQIIAESN